MNEQSSAYKALASYQSVLDRQGYKGAEALKRLHLARCILGSLEPDDSVNLAYRRAVDAVLLTMPDAAAADMCRQVSREFYPFHIESRRTSPAGQAASPAGEARGAEISLALPEHQGLDDLIRRAVDLKLDAEETRALNAYVAYLKVEKIDRRSRDNNLTIARLLLLGLRSLPRDGRHYRALIEKLMPLFSRDDTRAYFLGVAREFFSCVIVNPKAMPRAPDHPASVTEHGKPG